MTKQPFTQDEIKWNQWLAGVIDGDGYLAIQKNNVAVCEITMPLQDEALLLQIKQKLGGNVKLRSGSLSIRYRLGHKDGMIELLERINGHIRNSIRVIQFKTLCVKFKMIYRKAKRLTIEDGYIAGFFDADGTICFGVSKSSQTNSIKKGVSGKVQRLIHARGYHVLKVGMANKYSENLVMFQKAFGFGTIRKTKNKRSFTNHTYEIQLKDIPFFFDYTTKYPLRSSKRKRLFLLRKYFALKSVKAHLAEKGSLSQKAWEKFCYQWYNCEFLQ